MIVALLAALALARPTPVWIDLDPSVGVPDRDVDDGVALLQALASRELEVQGVSVVFGNAPLTQGLPIARDLLAGWDVPLPVHAGAAEPGRAATDASAALLAALERGPLTILALGPATNVAAALSARPDLLPRVRAVVAVAGRTPGQRFTTGTTNPRGHRDFNFEQDPAAFATLLALDVPLVLAGFEVSRKVWVTEAALDRWTGPAAALAGPARGWLDLWRRTFDVEGFNPFDTLAVAWLTRPALLRCETGSVRIEDGPDDRTEAALQGDDVATKPYLLVRPPTPHGRAVTWCPDVDADRFLVDLERRLRRGPRRGRRGKG